MDIWYSHADDTRSVSDISLLLVNRLAVDMIEYGVTSYKDTMNAYMTKINLSPSLSLSFLSLHEINLVVYQNSPGESKEYTTASEWWK